MMKLATVYTLRAGLAYHAFVAKQSPMKNLEELAVFFSCQSAIIRLLQNVRVAT